MPDSDKGQARDKAAEMLGVSPRYVQDAKKIEQDAPEVLEQVKQGKLSIPQAKKVAALPAEERPAGRAGIVATPCARRTLTPSQKAALAVALEKQLAIEAKKRRGTRTDLVSTLTPGDFGKAREKAAEMIGVSAGYIQEAKQIEQDAPEILEQVKQGKLSIPQAKQVAALPADERPAVPGSSPLNEKEGKVSPLF